MRKKPQPRPRPHLPSRLCQPDRVPEKSEGLHRDRQHHDAIFRPGRQCNAGGILTVRGPEIGRVQPLDKFLPIKGFGFYYENHGWMARIPHRYQQGSQRANAASST